MPPKKFATQASDKYLENQNISTTPSHSLREIYSDPKSIDKIAQNAQTSLENNMNQQDRKHLFEQLERNLAEKKSEYEANKYNEMKWYFGFLQASYDGDHSHNEYAKTGRNALWDLIRRKASENPVLEYAVREVDKQATNQNRDSVNLGSTQEKQYRFKHLFTADLNENNTEETRLEDIKQLAQTGDQSLNKLNHDKPEINEKGRKMNFVSTIHIENNIPLDTVNVSKKVIDSLKVNDKKFVVENMLDDKNLFSDINDESQYQARNYFKLLKDSILSENHEGETDTWDLLRQASSQKAVQEGFRYIEEAYEWYIFQNKLKDEKDIYAQNRPVTDTLQSLIRTLSKIKSQPFYSEVNKKSAERIQKYLYKAMKEEPHPNFKDVFGNVTKVPDNINPVKALQKAFTRVNRDFTKHEASKLTQELKALLQPEER